MPRRRKLKLPEPPDAEPALPFARFAAGLAVLVALGFLVLELGGRVLEDEGELAPAPVVEAPADMAPELRLLALENVRARVEIDGQVVFDGTLSGGTERSWPAGRITAVELEDLTRATVYYDGEIVEPLGSLSTARRLEFVDDL